MKLAAALGFAAGTAVVLWVFVRELSTPSSAEPAQCSCRLCESQRWAVEQNLAEYRRKRATATP